MRSIQKSSLVVRKSKAFPVASSHIPVQSKVTFIIDKIIEIRDISNIIREYIDGDVVDTHESIYDYLWRTRPPTLQECTCDGSESAYRIVKCLRHHSRYFKNKGCYRCNYTDCGKWGC